MEVYSEAELKALKEFKARVLADISDEFNRKDENLIRWLRARDLKVKEAEELFRKSQEWRKENQVDKILDSGLDPDMFAKFPFFYDGFDKEGRIVVTVPMGEWDVRESVENDGPQKFITYANQVLETISRKVRENHEKSNQPRAVRYTIVLDYEGFGLKQLANMKSVNTILQMVATFEAHYPETLQTAFVVNAPSVFSVLFNLMKPLMTARTTNKMKIFSDDRKKWEAEVLKAIDAKEIRARYGGTKE